MELTVVLPILQKLADGLDPETEREFPIDSPYHRPNVLRALHAATRVVEARIKAEHRARSLPPNAGKAWDEAEDQRLIKEFHDAVDFVAIAKAHERTRGSIVARLEALGKLKPFSDRRVE